MIPIYVINLRQDQEKYLRISESLNKFCFIDIRRVDAMAGSTLPDQICLKLTGDPAGKESKGAIGCMLSHIRAWELFLSSMDEWAVVIEDDAIVSDWSYLRELKLPAGFDVIFANDRTAKANLEHTNNPTFSQISECLDDIDRRHQAVGTDCYLISRKGAIQILSAMKDDLYFGHLDLRILAYSVCVKLASSLLKPDFLLHALNMHFNVTKRSPFLQSYSLSPSLTHHSIKTESSRAREDNLGVLK